MQQLLLVYIRISRTYHIAVNNVSAEGRKGTFSAERTIIINDNYIDDGDDGGDYYFITWKAANPAHWQAGNFPLRFLP